MTLLGARTAGSLYGEAINAEDDVMQTTNKKRPGKKEPTVDELLAAIAKATPTSTRSRHARATRSTSTTSRSGR